MKELQIKLTNQEYEALDKAIYVAIRDAKSQEEAEPLMTLQRKVWDAEIEDSEREDW